MNREGNLFVISRRISKFLEENPEQEAFLAEQPTENELTASYRAFSSRPDLGMYQVHANGGISLGFAWGMPRGLGRDLADEISGCAKEERYGNLGRNILYTIKRKA